MSYCHLTTSERTKIEVLKGLGYSCRAIARHLNRSHTTISRELKRLNEWTAEKAQWHAAAQKKKCGARSKFTDKLRKVIEEKLKATWSPEQIVGSLFQGKLSFKTIYRWLYSGKLHVTLQVLRQKGKRQAPRETRGRFNVGTSIQQRPKEVKTRETFGHWELDTVVSARGTKGCIATFAERKTRFYVGIQIPNRSAQSMKWAIEQLISRYPKQCFKRLRRIEEKNLAVTSTSKNSTASQFTSLIRTHLGNVARMKIVMVFYANFSQNEWIWDNSHYQK